MWPLEIFTQLDGTRIPYLAVAIIPTMKPGSFLLSGLLLVVCPLGPLAAIAQTNSAPKPSQEDTVLVPFVGCSSDGQVGPLKAPTGQSKAFAIPAAAAQRLAYFKAENGIGVLAPREWHCFSTYGSNGSNLYVTPDPINADRFFSSDWKGISGPGIQVSISSGGTSGRFQVAQVVARVFPEYKAFAQNVIAEGIEPASSFPFGPYPADKLSYHGKSVVEFETPANVEGLGTDSDLQSGPGSIEGVAIIFEKNMDLTQLSMRFTENDHALAQFIVTQVEREAAVSAP